MNLKKLLAVLGIAASMGLARVSHAAEPFVKGLDTYFTYVPATEGTADKSLRVDVSGQEVTIHAMGRGNELMVVMEGARESRPVVYRETWSEGDEYLVAVHDFSGDGVPEILVAVRGNDHLSVRILDLRSGGKTVLGEMVSQGHGIREARVFRQAVTMKCPQNNVLYTWTCHNGVFDFLSSDHRDNPSDLL
ncbi:MAG: hypothetical protein IJU74_04905 [Bacteroidales bacterium]|nr:hypothetical protein [Bacteroidales bacterium]